MIMRIRNGSRGAMTVCLAILLFGMFADGLPYSAPLIFDNKGDVGSRSHYSKRLTPVHDNFILRRRPYRGNQHCLHTLTSIPPGGGLKATSNRRSTAGNETSTPNLKVTLNRRTLTVACSCVLLISGLWYQRELWTPFFNKERLQQSAVTTLHRLNDLPKVTSYVSYILGMGLWEAAGLSTIPVETAAGMVFGWPHGFWLNAMGKLMGAAFAFGLGRSPILSRTIDQQFSSNSFLQGIQATAKERPLQVTFLLKFGPMPETIKNFGAAFLKPIRWWMFLLATIVHGWTFSALWTYLGVDTAARLEDIEGILPPDRRLQLLLTLALINGIVVSPLSLVWLCSRPTSWQFFKRSK